MKKILVTAALPYANGPIHLGHMVEHVQADIWVRWQKLCHRNCLFICGDDAHGTPIMLSAKQQNLTPEELIVTIKRQHEQDFADFGIAFDNYYTTHSPENQELSEKIYRQLRANDDIEVRTVTQAYDPIANIFLPDRFVRGTCPRCHASDQYGDNCEVCGATYSPSDLKDAISVISGATPIEKSSEHYFFRLEKYTAMLKRWVTSGSLQPAIANKLQEWFDQGLKQWDISRDAPYFGFPIPDTKDKYFYVWLDAPIGYMASFKNLCDRRSDLQLKFEEYWEENSKTELYHFIGKDIVYFHSLFWPALLKGSNLRQPTNIFVHGYLTVNNKKMSKSRGTFILARDYLNSGLNPEYLRYYFAAKLDSGIDDIDLNLTDFIQRVNSDLVGKVVNIASRCAGFINKNFGHRLAATLDNAALFEHFQNSSDAIADAYQQLEYSTAVRLIMGLADKANQYIDEKKPWQLAKLLQFSGQSSEQFSQLSSQQPSKQRLHLQPLSALSSASLVAGNVADTADTAAVAVHNICTMGINLFRLLALYLKPILPQMAQAAELFLNITPLMWHDRTRPLLNHTINDFQPLMQRVDVAKVDVLCH